MKLKKVWIYNFRSISELTINFEKNCRILVGLNESGKSNILKALRLLSNDYKSSNNDVRVPLHDEELPDQSEVRFIFELEKEEIDLIYENINDKLLFITDDNIANNGSKNISINEFSNLYSEGLYCADILKGTKYASRWSLNKKITVNNNWKLISDDCPNDYMVSKDGENPIPLSDFTAVNEDEFSEIPKQYIKTAKISDIDKICGATIIEIVKKKKPDCIFWEYSDNNLLPGKINIANFSSDPNTCIPLKIMFNLAEITNIGETIEKEKKRSFGMRNMLSRIADRTTQHIHSIWSEYKDIQIYLSENGENIDAGIQEKSNVYNFEQRSDGFKRFITFLILISAKERTNQLNDNLILIDEPDTCLHPSGAKFLKNELINISNTNHIVFSTHSIFMIDKNDISRHYIINKNNEITRATIADKSNIFDEEVLYNAIGHSTFESLNTKNLIFEGWRDKNLFRTSLKSTKNKTIIRNFLKVGTCHAEGVKDISRIASLLELANKKFIIVSDDDKVAIQKQKEYKGDGKWYRYSDLLGSGKITSEDFVKKTHYTESLKATCSEFTELTGKSIPLFNNEYGRLETTKAWLVTLGLEKSLIDTILNNLKGKLFNNINATHVDEKYYSFLQKLSEIINS